MITSFAAIQIFTSAAPATSPTYDPATHPWPASKGEPAQITTSTNPTAPNVILTTPRMYGRSTRNNIPHVVEPTPPEVEEPTLQEEPARMEPPVEPVTTTITNTMLQRYHAQTGLH